MQNTRETKIREIVEKAFRPVYLELENESKMHNVPAGSETHFRLLIVSERFKAESRVARQRLVNQELAAEFQAGLHALSMRIYTPEEWQALGEKVEMKSPECLGGSKHDKAK